MSCPHYRIENSSGFSGRGTRNWLTCRECRAELCPDFSLTPDAQGCKHRTFRILGSLGAGKELTFHCLDDCEKYLKLQWELTPYVGVGTPGNFKIHLYQGIEIPCAHNEVAMMTRPGDFPKNRFVRFHCGLCARFVLPKWKEVVPYVKPEYSPMTRS